MYGENTNDSVSLSINSKVDQASSKLEDAFDRSKSFFLEEAQAILRNTIGQSPITPNFNKARSIQRGRYGNACNVVFKMCMKCDANVSVQRPRRLTYQRALAAGDFKVVLV